MVTEEEYLQYSRFRKYWFKWYFRYYYLKTEWKLGIHLVLGTYYFGVNNQWSSSHESMFGIPIRQRTPLTIYKRYKHLVARSFASYAIPGWHLKILWPKQYRKFK